MNYHLFLKNPYDPADPQNQAQIEVGLRFLGNIAILWELSDSQKRAILHLSLHQFQKIVIDNNLEELDDEMMVKLRVRLSWLATVRKEIELTWPEDCWDEYVNAPNTQLGGKSLVDLMVETEDGLLAAKRYVLASTQTNYL